GDGGDDEVTLIATRQIGRKMAFFANESKSDQCSAKRRRHVGFREYFRHNSCQAPARQWGGRRQCAATRPKRQAWCLRKSATLGLCSLRRATQPRMASTTLA